MSCLLRGLPLLALTLPWLTPWAAGPSPAVQPWLVTLGCLALLLWFSLRRLTDPGLLATAWLVAALVSSVIGLCQYFGVAPYFPPWMNPSEAGVAFANLRQRNQFATLTNIGLVVLLWWCANRWTKGSAGRAQQFGWLVAAVLLAWGNAASSSRTGLVQLLLLGGLVWLWGSWRQPQTRRLLVVALLAYAVALVALPTLVGFNPFEHGMWGRLRSGDSVCGSRLTLWRNVLHLISQRPWLGWGWGELDYAHFMALYDGVRFCEILGNAHNLPLHLAVELGLPAAGLVCGALLWLALRARPWRERDPARQMAWGVLAVILLHSLLEYPLWYGPFLLACALCLGLLGPQRKGAVDAAGAGMVAVRWQRTGAVALLAAVAYAAWDYQRISQIYLDPAQRSAAYREDTLEKIRGSWLFDHQVRFAELTLTPVTRDNAAQLNILAHELLHYSPEARVVEKLIESAVWLGRDDEALLFLARYRAAYPQAHARWVSANKL